MAQQQQQQKANVDDPKSAEETIEIVQRYLPGFYELLGETLYA